MSIGLLAHRAGGAGLLTADDDGLLDDAARLANVVTEAADNSTITWLNDARQCFRAERWVHKAGCWLQGISGTNSLSWRCLRPCGLGIVFVLPARKRP